MIPSHAAPAIYLLRTGLMDRYGVKEYIITISVMPHDASIQLYLKHAISN